MSTPERAGREGDQPLPTPGQGGDVLGELIELLQERRKVGLKRYGRPLQAFNGRDAARDLEEELLDAAAYARQDRVEKDTLEKSVLVMARALRGGAPAFGGVEAALEVADAVAFKLGRLKSAGPTR